MASPVVVSRIQNRRGLQAQFEALYPSGYVGIGGYGSGDYDPPFDEDEYPDVLMPGELALCTDTRRMFVGNINGEYLEIVTSGDGTLSLPGLKMLLPPVAIFTNIDGLAYLPDTFTSPFITILYSLTDSGTIVDPNIPGTDFSRNGLMQITATTTDVTLTDSGTEINTTAGPSTFSFQAVLNMAGGIDVQYKHDFPGDLALVSDSIHWRQIGPA